MQALADGLRAGLRFRRRDSLGGQLRAGVGDHLIGRFCGGRVGGGVPGRFCHPRVGDHLIGRFWWQLPSPSLRAVAKRSRRTSGRQPPFRDECRYSAGFAAATSPPPQGDDLLFLFFFQDVTHIAEGNRPRLGINVLDCGLSLAGFQVIIDGRFWVITEDQLTPFAEGQVPFAE